MHVSLKPRPVSLTLGHSNYLPFKWPFDIEYRPFFALETGPLGATAPPDATEVYTLPSSALATSLSKLYDDILPRLDTEVPDPNISSRSKWYDLLQRAVENVDSSFRFQLECENHIVRLVKGDRAPAPPPTSRRTPDFSPEWYNIVHSTLLRGDVELRDESRDAELELFVWAYMFYIADDRTHIWRAFRGEMYKLTTPDFAACLPSAYPEYPGLLSSVSDKASAAVSAIVSAFTSETSVNKLESPWLKDGERSDFPSIDSAPSPYTGDVDDVLHRSILHASSSNMDEASSSRASDVNDDLRQPVRHASLSNMDEASSSRAGDVNDDLRRPIRSRRSRTTNNVEKRRGAESISPVDLNR